MYYHSLSVTFCQKLCLIMEVPMTHLANLQKYIPDVRTLFGFNDQSSADERETPMLNGRLVQDLSSTIKNKDFMANVSLAVIQGVSALALASIGIAFMSTYGLTLLSVVVSAVFLGSAVYVGDKFFNNELISSLIKTQSAASFKMESKIAELKEKTLDQLNELYKSFTGKEFNEHFSAEDKEIFLKEKGHGDVRAMIDLLAETSIQLEEFSGLSERFDHHLDTFSYIRGNNERDDVEFIDRCFNFEFNQFLITSYCRKKLESAYSVYLLINPKDKDLSLVSKGEFLWVSYDKAYALDMGQVPFFSFNHSKDFVSVKEICYKIGTSKPSTVLDVTGILWNSIGEQQAEIQAKQQNLPEKTATPQAPNPEEINKG